MFSGLIFPLIFIILASVCSLGSRDWGFLALSISLVLCRMLEETGVKRRTTSPTPKVHIHNVMWALFGRKGSRDNLREFILLCCLLDDNFLSNLCFIVIVTKPSPLAKINFAVAFSDSSTNLRSQSSEIQRWHSSHNLKETWQYYHEYVDRCCWIPILPNTDVTDVDTRNLKESLCNKQLK